MATFFARRYMRKLEWVSRTEIALGAVLILLLIAIVAAFAIVVRTDQNYLFDIDPAAYTDDTPSHKLAVAQRMLPPLPDSPWPDPGQLEAFDFETLAEALQDDAESFTAFEVRAVYRRRYTAKNEPGSELTVLVADAGTPAQAFGLCIARGADASSPLGVGRDSWHSPDSRRAGFWQGRYYTELAASPAEPDSSSALKTAAAVLAELQLDYGASFWAVGLLPAQPHFDDSFRYLHRAAFGIGGLDEIFAVDLDTGGTAWVHDAGNPSGAIEMLKTTAESASTASASEDEYDTPETSTVTGIRYDGPLTIVPASGVLGVEMALFTSDRYLFGAYGLGLDLAELTKQHYERVSAITAASTARLQTVATSAPAADAGPTFPDIDIAGWKPPQKLSHFTPETLYEKINGRADAYLQYKVSAMLFGTYFHSSDPSRTIDVYWYDMGESVNAFGIYQLEAPPTPNTVSIGDAAYETGGAVFFRKGGSYVQVLPTSSGQAADADVAMAIAGRIADRIEGGGGDLWAQDALPEAGRVPDSFNFVAQDPFGLDFLSDVFTADYNHASGRMTLFIHRADDEPSAQALLDEYQGFMEKYGRVLPGGTNDVDAFLAGEVAGLIDVVFVKGHYLGGVGRRR